MKKLGFGCARLPLMNMNDQATIDMEQFNHMVDLFLQKGFTYFDTAYTYHEYKSEIAVREALVKRYLRQSFQLATKLPVYLLKSKKDQEQIFNEQLQKCGVEYFDVYLLHAITRNTYKTALKCESFQFLKQLKKEGQVRHIGMSYHDDADLLEEILMKHPELEYIQLQINYLDWENEIIQSQKCYEIAKKYSRKIIVMEPVKGGSLINIPQSVKDLFQKHSPDMSVASWAIRFAASLDVEVVLSGMSDYKQMEDNLDYMKEFNPINTTEYNIIMKASDLIKREIIVPCTGCHYCTTDCPQKIPIPEYLGLYNSLYRSHGLKIEIAGAIETERIAYEHYFQNNRKASDCIQCGQCESVCPQHLSVIKWLKEVTRCLESR